MEKRLVKILRNFNAVTGFLGKTHVADGAEGQWSCLHSSSSFCVRQSIVCHLCGSTSFARVPESHSSFFVYKSKQRDRQTKRPDKRERRKARNRKDQLMKRKDRNHNEKEGTKEEEKEKRKERQEDTPPTVSRSASHLSPPSQILSPSTRACEEREKAKRETSTVDSGAKAGRVGVVNGIR
mmetsp:Transcript_28239/g.55288  ORF Transcript_28239/g.55288 Transcript_28239/m.55288 type:complete len:181 (-) Transcript_28239:702-1244(-)